MYVKLNQKGMTTTTIIGFVLILIIVGFTGWRVMEANKAIDNNKVVSNEPVKNNATKDEIKTSSVPDGYTEYSNNGLTFYYPKTQQPAKDVTAVYKKASANAVSAVDLNDYDIVMYTAADLQLQMGIGAPWVCDYVVESSTFTLNKAKSFNGIASNACEKFNKKDVFNTIEFNNLSTAYEARTIMSYAAPTKDNKYFVKISNMRDDGKCYQGESTQEECSERSTEQLNTLKSFVSDFTEVNENIFK